MGLLATFEKISINCLNKIVSPLYPSRLLINFTFPSHEIFLAKDPPVQVLMTSQVKQCLAMMTPRHFASTMIQSPTLAFPTHQHYSP
mmetsp:Transcript_2399/g.5149  ORF Transcript_2399/g.5149 Transcript_2399/m.5149 type:complete len:87 (-) Transcript_2399:70-330(-)